MSTFRWKITQWSDGNKHPTRPHTILNHQKWKISIAWRVVTQRILYFLAFRIGSFDSGIVRPVLMYTGIPRSRNWISVFQFFLRFSCSDRNVPPYGKRKKSNKKSHFSFSITIEPISSRSYLRSCHNLIHTLCTVT